MRALLPYWTNRSLASDLFNEFDRLFEDQIRVPTKSYAERNFDPACEIVETNEHYHMSVDLPGMKKDDIKVEMNENLLTISGERRREAVSEEKKKFQRYEKSYGFFKRSFALPTSVATDKIEAQYENGVLELYLPKVQAAKPRQIEVQSGKSGFFEKFLGSKKEDVKDVGNNKAS